MESKSGKNFFQVKQAYKAKIMKTGDAIVELLEREGERMGLVITKGFGDLLKIGDQTRSDM